MTGTPAPADPVPARRVLGQEVLLVLGLSLGTSALYAVLDLARTLSAGKGLRAQHAVITASATPNGTLDLLYQLLGIAYALVPVLLVLHFLRRGGETAGAIGLDDRRPGREAAWGAGLACVIGGAGLGLYLAAYGLGLDVRVVPTDLPPSWWRVPVLLLAAAQNGILEEVVVCGFLLHRLRQLAWSDDRSLLASAALRGAYHLYQGVGGFLGNAAMGLVFGRLFQRQGRLGRLVLAHSLIDAGAFVGYVYLKGKVSWLP